MKNLKFAFLGLLFSVFFYGSPTASAESFVPTLALKLSEFDYSQSIDGTNVYVGLLGPSGYSFADHKICIAEDGNVVYVGDISGVITGTAAENAVGYGEKCISISPPDPMLGFDLSTKISVSRFSVLKKWPNWAWVPSCPWRRAQTSRCDLLF